MTRKSSIGATEGQTRPSVAARLLIRLVAGYRRGVSPLLPDRCRFAPSCSAYALQAITEHGALRGSWLALCRLGRCHPFHPGGYDPVPPRRDGASAPAGASALAGPPRSAKAQGASW